MRRIVTDVLTVWALEHPKPGYRQGMHELLAPIVFVLDKEKVRFTT